MTPNNLTDFDKGPAAPGQIVQGPLATLLEWQAMAEGAYSPNTLRAQKADGAIFQAYCESHGVAYLPADPMTIRAFIEDRQRAGKKPATIKRYVATIARAHTAAGLLNPCSSEAVRLGLKKMGRETSARQDQAHPPWDGRTLRNLSTAPALASVPIASARCSAWLTKPSLVVASSSLSTSRILIYAR